MTSLSSFFPSLFSRLYFVSLSLPLLLLLLLEPEEEEEEEELLDEEPELDFLLFLLSSSSTFSFSFSSRSFAALAFAFSSLSFFLASLLACRCFLRSACENKTGQLQHAHLFSLALFSGSNTQSFLFHFFFLQQLHTSVFLFFQFLFHYFLFFCFLQISEIQ